MTQIGYLSLYLTLYRTALRAVGMEVSTRGMVRLWAGSLVANMALPGSGNAVFIAEASRQGNTVARTTAGLLLMRTADIAGFALLLLVSLLYLGLWGRLLPGEVIAAGALLLIGFAWSVPFLIALRHPRTLARGLAFAERLAARLHIPIKVGWSARVADEARSAAEALAADPGILLRLLILSLTAHLADLVSFALLLPAFHVPMRPEVALAGFSAALLF
jgi:hypothetical protein